MPIEAQKPEPVEEEEVPKTAEERVQEYAESTLKVHKKFIGQFEAEIEGILNEEHIDGYKKEQMD